MDQFASPRPGCIALLMPLTCLGALLSLHQSHVCSTYCIAAKHSVVFYSVTCTRCLALLQDTSTGQIIAQHRSKMGPCDVLRQNPYNAVSLLGHSQGVVSMWTPNLTTPVVKLLAHKVSTAVCLPRIYTTVHVMLTHVASSGCSRYTPVSRSKVFHWYTLMSCRV